MKASRHEHLITRRAHPELCRCGALVLDGWAEGVHTRVAALALNRAGELAAILAGHHTYTLTRNGLVHRDKYRITNPAGPILATHRCGHSTPTEHRTPNTPIANLAITSEEIPF